MLGNATRALIIVVLTVGCSSTDTAPIANTEAEIAAIKAAFASLVKVSEAGDAEGYASYLTDDAIYLGPGQPAIMGKQKIRDFVADFFKNWNFSFPQWTTEEVIVAGEIAIHRYSGVATLTPKSGGEPLIADRKYMDVMRKETDGQWRLARHMLNLNR